MREITSAENWLLIVLGMAASGVLYSVLMFPNEPAFIGAIFAVLIGLPILAFERRVLLRPLYRRIEKLPTVLFILSALVIYEILMSIGYAAAGLILWGMGLVKPTSLADLVIIPFEVFLYALGVCGLIVFILRVRDLLGHDVFTSMLISRYRNPVKEERVFLFIDLADSTSYAEKHGDLRAQELIGALFAAYAEPVRRHKGAIDDYIGDAAIITWPFARGIRNARCIRCVFDILSAIEADAESWRRNFGQVPRLRAALHGGFIITAEIGVDHHKIAYFGDTVNTTARLEALCRTLNKPVLISTELAERMTVPSNVEVEDLGVHALKGRGQTLGVMALRPHSTVTHIDSYRRQIPAE